MKSYFEKLERLSTKSLSVAKRNAGMFELGVWELPSGRYIALDRGIKVPEGSRLVAKRFHHTARWKSVQQKEV